MISIVTPSFRQLNWLALAMASVADQAGPEIEHIVQDAGSEGAKDFSTEARRLYPHQNYRPQFWIEKDASMYDAINRGLEKSKGEICAYLNCDEQYLPGALARVVAFFSAHPTTDLLLANSIVVADDGSYICSRPALLPWLVEMKAGRMYNLSCSMFFRARLFRERRLLFNPSLRVIGDLDWLRRVLEAGARVATLDYNTSVFTDLGTNLALSPATASELTAAMEGRARIIKPALVILHRLRRLLAGHYRPLAFEYSIYTPSDPTHRRPFQVAKPTGVWRNRL